MLMVHLLPQGGRRLDVRIDPTELPEGVHYAEILGFDTRSPERGPIFRLPVTVIRPEGIDEERALLVSQIRASRL